MEKIISINLAGQILPMEETAYNRLNAYFDSLRTYFRNQEGGDEILSDIESRVAELLMEKKRLGAPAINALHIAEVESQLGSVEDFRKANGPETENETSDTGPTPPPKTGPRRRFFRDPNDKVVGGVCAGLAGYFNVDPALVRIIFGVLALAGWGTGFVLYIALWFLVPQSAENAYKGRRLYRSAEDKWIGGVCGGLAAYFEKDPWVFRLVFGLPLLASSGFGIGLSVIGGSLSGGVFLIYILLWIVLPLAKTDFQKMELRGEKIDLHTIRNNVYSDLKNRSHTFAQEAREAADRLSTEARTAFSPAARTGASVIGRIVRGVFLAISAFVAFILFVLLIGYFFGDFSKMANLYLFQSPRQKTLALLTVVLLLGMPLLSVLTALLRSTLKLPSSVRYARLSFNLLWLCGFVTLGFLISSLAKSVQRQEVIRQATTLPVADSGTLLVQTVGNPIRYRNTLAGLRGPLEGLDIDEDSLRTEWVDFRVIPSADSLYHLAVIRSSYGYRAKDAREKARNISYPIATGAAQAPGLLSLPTGFALAQKDYYRGQQVALELQVPVGRKVQFDASTENTLLDNYTTHTSFRFKGNRRQWKYRRAWQSPPEAGVAYVMNSNGKLRRADGASEEDVDFDRDNGFSDWEDEEED